MHPDTHYIKPTLACIIGMYPDEAAEITNGIQPEELDQSQVDALIAFGRSKDLKLHRFKKTMGLPRVAKVMGALKGIYPKTILDIGTGRGVFLWPLLDTFPDVEVTCVDILPYRIETLNAVKNGGLHNITPVLGDFRNLGYEDASFDVVTFLETLEHIEEPAEVLLNALRMAKTALILSVPSGEDDNPEHIHLLGRDFFEKSLSGQPGLSLSYDYVFNHMIVVVFKTGIVDRNR